MNSTILTSRPVLFGLLVIIFFGLAIFFGAVFRGDLILPQVLDLGPLQVHYYGLCLALAVTGAYWLAVRRSPRYGIERARAEYVIFIILLSGFIGARIYHVLSIWDFYQQSPELIAAVWRGGLSIFGALFGGLIGLALAKIFSHSSFSPLSLLDWLAPSLVLGQIIGRLGNVFNYEAFGYATALPWKMYVPEVFRPIELAASAFFHPWFLYEMLWSGAILMLLLRWGQRRRQPGTLFFGYLLLYNIGRFFLEFLRVDSTFLGAWRLNSLVSLVLVVVAVSALILIFENAHARKISSVN